MNINSSGVKLSALDTSQQLSIRDRHNTTQSRMLPQGYRLYNFDLQRKKESTGKVEVYAVGREGRERVKDLSNSPRLELPRPSLHNIHFQSSPKAFSPLDFRGKSNPDMNTPASEAKWKEREESTRPSPQKYDIKWTGTTWPRIEEHIRVDKLIGQGSFAKVYQGVDLVNQTNVAIKVLDKKKICDMGFQKMVDREVEIIQSVHHPNICKFEKLLEDKNRVV